MTLKEQIYIVCKAAAAMPSGIFLIQRQEKEEKNQTQNQHSEPQCAECKTTDSFQVISQTYAIRVSPYESVRMSQSVCVSKSWQTQFFQVTYEQVTKENWVFDSFDPM